MGQGVLTSVDNHLVANTAAQPIYAPQPLRPQQHRGLTASTLLTPQIQQDLQLLYDFLAALHTITDTTQFVDETREYLIDTFEQIIDGSWIENDIDPVAFTMVAFNLQQAHQCGRMQPQWALRLIQAARRDMSRPTCSSWSDLMLYCRYAAEPLSRAVLELNGISEENIQRATDALCAALLVLRLVRRAGEDWKLHGRCYLPTDWFREANGTAEQLVERHSTPAVKHVTARVIERTEALLALAQPLPQLLAGDPFLKAEALRLLGHARYQIWQLKLCDPLTKKLTTPFWVRGLIRLQAWWLAKR